LLKKKIHWIHRPFLATLEMAKKQQKK
jgi:hypothetical protein